MDSAITFLNRPDLSVDLVQRAFKAERIPLSTVVVEEIVSQRKAGPFLSDWDVLARTRGVAPIHLADLGDAVFRGRLDDVASPVQLLISFFQQPTLTPSQVDKAFEVAGRDIGPIIGRSLIKAGRRGALKTEDDFVEVRFVGAKRLALMLDAAATGQLFLQQHAIQSLLFLGSEGIGRTVERTNCNIGNTQFGINLYGRYTKTEGGLQFDVVRILKKRRLVKLRPDFRLTSNCEIGVAVTADVRGDFKGSQIVEVFRNAGADPDGVLPASQSNASLRRTIAGVEDLETLISRGKKISDIRVEPPPKIRPGQIVRETIAIRYTWNPDSGEPCGITERLTVSWVGDRKGSNPRYRLPKRISSTNHPYVTVGGTVDEPREGDKSQHYTVSAFTFFPVDVSKGCCKEKGASFAVIQFARHVFKFTSDKKPQQDEWSLDILGDEVKRASTMDDYDPTYTLDPCDRKAKAREKAQTEKEKNTINVPPPVVYPGPDANLKSAITLVDAPGFSKALYDALVDRGEYFTWQFYSFLVCKLTDCNASVYLADGKVKGYLNYQLKVTFSRSKNAVSVKAERKMFKRVRFEKCKSFKDVVDEIDSKRSKTQTRLEGTLVGGYTTPREHKIGVKRRRSPR